MAASISKSGRPLLFAMAAVFVVLVVVVLVGKRTSVPSNFPLRTSSYKKGGFEGGGHIQIAVGGDGGGKVGGVGSPFFSLFPDGPFKKMQGTMQTGGSDASQQKKSEPQQKEPLQRPQFASQQLPPQQPSSIKQQSGSVDRGPLQVSQSPQQQIPVQGIPLFPLGEKPDVPKTAVNSESPQLRTNPGVQLTTPTGNNPIPETPVSTVPPLPTFYPSKDLFVRAVHFDSRPRDGHHNVSVFLVVCLKTITDNNLIQGCQVDGQAALEFKVKLIGETPLWRAFYDYINHEEVLVHCYDLPAQNGSTGHIVYRKTAESALVLAASERPLLMPAPRIDPRSKEGKKYNLTIVACTKIFNNPPWLKEWITYQKTLGVDHVHLDAEDSFKRNGGMRDPFLTRMIEEGFLSVDIWKEYLSGGELWYHNQGLIYEDCPYRFRGTYDYIMMMDTDDFFTPRVPTEKQVHYYINRFCRGRGIGSCKFRWVEYYPEAVGMNKNVSIADGNMTKALMSYSHYNQGNPKSLHRTTVLIDTATHYAYEMMPGYKIVTVSVNDAYVAHVRLYKKELPKPNQGLVTGLPKS